jgi:hypothetical protein
MFKRFSVPLAFITPLITLGTTLGATHAAAAADYNEGQWVTTFTAGTALMPHGTFQAGAAGAVADLGSLNATLAGESAAVAVDRLSLHDAFRIGPSLGVETGYMSDSNLEPFVRLDYSQLGGRTTRIGQMTSSALASPAAITANFGDLDSWALNAGARYFFVNSGALRPFLAGYVGADRSDALYTHVAVNGVQSDMGRELLLPRETRFDAGVETGMNYQVSDQAAVRFSVGANYVQPRHEESSAFESLGLGPVGIADQRWSIPIDLGLTYQF